MKKATRSAEQNRLPQGRLSIVTNFIGQHPELLQTVHIVLLTMFVLFVTGGH
ncbi:hypothetical protein KRX52_11180 [Pseudomonas sp. MAP12]|uniref:Uncharacterized protein n=1 Tax=Geopseudomonas aromaticivorans TaxID=2849492 RepID=A0ABS6MX43_9GAMM|nr:hypothetical protein [Pseudomonas aromaticivorans]MBV2133356.1 hypothetical protein [Pseudomonas aromaticivorans]